VVNPLARWGYTIPGRCGRLARRPGWTPRTGPTAELWSMPVPCAWGVIRIFTSRVADAGLVARRGWVFAE